MLNITRLRIKRFDDIIAHAKKNPLKRSLTSWDLIALGLGCIIGTGIFVLTGVAAAKYAGPALIISFALSAVACGLAALAYAELAAMVPVAGSAYTYTYGVLGEAVAWLVGWNLVLEYAVSGGAVAAGWSGYMVGIFASGGVEIPKDFTAVPANGGIMDLPAMLITLFLTFLLVQGTKESSKFNIILVGVKLLAIFIFLAIAAPNVDFATNWENFMPYGFAGVSTGAAIIFFAYVGFDAVATASEEAKNPNRDVPIGIIGSLIICTLLYIAVSAVLTGVVSYEKLNNAEPLAFALREIGFPFGSALVAVGAVAGITTVLLVLMYGQTRIFFVMARDGLLPKAVTKLHPKYNTPHVITIITGGGIALLAGFVPIDVVAELSNIGTLFAFIIVAIGVMILRVTDPERPRPFKCPWVWTVCIGAVVSCAYLMYSLPDDTWVRFAVWTLIGMLFYGFYGYRKSPLHKAVS